MRKLLSLAVATAALVVSPACDSVDPVAPEDSVLTISVSPTFIALEGEATVTVQGRKGNGQPINKGSEVFFSTDLGTIDQSAKTDDNGIALATLRGDGRAGDAIVTATSGAAAAATFESVQIGSFAALISLQVTPTLVQEDGGKLDLLALVRDDTGVLLPNAVVNFGTEFGILDSAGASVITDITGEARDRLTVSAADVAGAGNSFRVSSQTSGTGGTLIEATFNVSVVRLNPIASFRVNSAGGNAVSFLNESTGAEPLEFAWDFQSDGQVDSTQRNPLFDYVDPGTYTVRLSVTNEFGTDTAVATITVPL